MLEPQGMPPMEVFALDENRQRISAPINYTSLLWNRKYYGCGDFSMTVPSTIYDPDWRFIYTYDRPETGIVQKVEFSDSSRTPDGADTVTVSGFFLERIMDARVILDESMEEVLIQPDPPNPPAMNMDTSPQLYIGSDGKYYQSLGSKAAHAAGVENWDEQYYGLKKFDGTTDLTINMGTEAGEAVQGGVIENEDGTLSTSEGVTLTKIDVVSSNNYSYLSSDGDVIYSDGTEGHVMSDPLQVGAMHYARDESGRLVYLNGFVHEDTAGDYFYRKMAYEEQLTQLVKGPWSRVSESDTSKEMDNLVRLEDWAQELFGNWLTWELPPFEGTVKALQPGTTSFMDLLYSELKTEEASYRVSYQFELDGFAFSFWRGVDRTQDAVQPKTAAMRASSAPIKALSTDAEWRGLPSGFTQLDYIDSSGTQHIDTGCRPDSGTRVVIDFEMLGAMPSKHAVLFGSRYSSGSTSYVLGYTGHTTPHAWRSDYGSDTTKKFPESIAFNGRKTADKNGSTCTMAGQQVVSSSGPFTSDMPLYLFAMNEGGSAINNSSARIYSCIIYDGGSLTRDFVPCVRESDNEAGFYDLVSSQFYGNSGTGAFEVGDPVPEPDALNYYANGVGATGTMQPTAGVVGGQVEVAECSFAWENHTFIAWNTEPDGGGDQYDPGDYYVLTDGNDVLYAQWRDDAPEPPQPEGTIWAVFSDTWGQLCDYTASWDRSNEKNTALVMYDYEAPTSWQANGAPTYVNEGTASEPSYVIPYESKRGYLTVRLDDGQAWDSEIAIDRRSDKPEGDSEWSRDAYTEEPTDLPSLQDAYAEFENGLKQQAISTLKNDYSTIVNLDTGTVVTNEYRKNWDLGDKVDLAVNSIGLVETARIIGIEESHDENGAQIHIEIGDSLITTIKKAVMASNARA